jgi:hypothetical protein
VRLIRSGETGEITARLIAVGLLESGCPDAGIPSRFPREVTESDRSDCQCVSGGGDEALVGFTPSGSGSGDIDARDVKAQEAAEGCAEYERPQKYRQDR